MSRKSRSARHGSRSHLADDDDDHQSRSKSARESRSPSARSGVKPRYQEAKPIVKRLTLYRNGDPSFRPVLWTYNSHKVKNFDKVLQEIDDRVPARRLGWGQGGVNVRNLWSIDGSKRVRDLQELHDFDGDKVVAGGSEGFVEVQGGYENIPPRSPKREHLKKRDKDKDYRKENKKRYDVKRSEDQKIYNRGTEGGTKKFMIYRNGDEKFRPKTYILRPKQTPNWETFLEDMKRLVPPSDKSIDITVFDAQTGDQVESFDEIQMNGNYAIGEGHFEKVHGGYGQQNTDQKQSNRKQSKNRKQEAGGGQRKRQEGGDNWRDPGGAETGENSDNLWNEEEAKEKDKELLDRHREKMEQSGRPADQMLMNRDDQTKPVSFMIFVFLNGNGIDVTRCQFTWRQLDRGMPWFMEQVAKKFSVYPWRLVTLDNRKIKQVSELKNRGAYVLIPLGQKFRDTWYYAPDDSKDTSADAEEEEKEEEGDDDRYDDEGRSEDERDRDESKRRGDRQGSRKRRDRDGARKKRHGDEEEDYTDGNSDDSRTESRRGDENDEDWDRQSNGSDDDDFKRYIRNLEGRVTDLEREREHESQASRMEDNPGSAHSNRRERPQSARSQSSQRSMSSHQLSTDYKPRKTHRRASSNSTFRPTSGRPETRGARKVRDSRETKVERVGQLDNDSPYYAKNTKYR